MVYLVNYLDFNQSWNPLMRIEPLRAAASVSVVAGREDEHLGQDIRISVYGLLFKISLTRRRLNDVGAA